MFVKFPTRIKTGRQTGESDAPRKREGGIMLLYFGVVTN